MPRTYVSIDRVLRIMYQAGYLNEPAIQWTPIATALDAVVYFRRPADKPGRLGHKPVWEIHFERAGSDKNWRFGVAFLRESTGDGNDDMIVRQVQQLAAAVKP